MPFWLRNLTERCTEWYARHYRLALCQSHGTGIKVSNPRHLVISGPGIELGHQIRMDAAPDAQIHLSCWPFHAAGRPAPRITLGDYCTLSPGARLIAAERIEAGHSCMFASHVYVTDADWHGVQHRVFPPGETAPVLLGNNVWLGDGARLLKGVEIGDNTIVAAGAVVVGDLPANVIAAGNPARVVRELAPDAPSTTRRELFESLGYAEFETKFWRERLAHNSLWSWLLGAVWPAQRRTPFSVKSGSGQSGESAHG